MDKNEWYVYIIRCKDDKLYVGIAKDVEKRVQQHNRGTAGRFTKYRNPVNLLFVEEQANYMSARKRERAIKGFTAPLRVVLRSNFYFTKIDPIV